MKVRNIDEQFLINAMTKLGHIETNPEIVKGVISIISYSVPKTYVVGIHGDIKISENFPIKSKSSMVYFKNYKQIEIVSRKNGLSIDVLVDNVLQSTYEIASIDNPSPSFFNSDEADSWEDSWEEISYNELLAEDILHND